MVLRLVRDVIWRQRSMYLWMFPIVGLVWATVALDVVPITTGMTLSLVMSYALGPMATITNFGMRTIRVLPVTNRDLWIATCTISTLVMTSFLMVVQALAVSAVLLFSGSSAVPPETLMLAAVYNFAYAGLLLPVWPALGYASNNIASRRPRWLWIALTTVCLLVFIGGFGLPYLFAGALPRTIGQFTVPTTLALVVCLAMTGAAWAWTPTRGGIVSGNQAAGRIGATSSVKPRERFADRFTGIARIAWPYAGLTVLVSAVTIAGFVGYWSIFESGPLREFMQQNALVPFETSFRVNLDDIGGMWVLFAAMLITMMNPWGSFGRQLKVSPLSSHEINTLFLATPLAAWTIIWLALLMTHIAVIGDLPSTLRPDVFVLLTGATACSNAIMFRYHGMSTGWVIGLMGGLSTGLSRSFRSEHSGWTQVTLAAVGLVALGLAAFINHRTLTRSSSSSKAYRPAQAPFEITGPGAPR